MVRKYYCYIAFGALISFFVVIMCLFIAIPRAHAEIGRTEWVRSGNTVSTSFIKTRNIAAQGMSALTGTQISYSFTAFFSRPFAEKEGDYDVISVPGLELWQYPAGNPILPFKPVRLLVPAGKKAVGVRVTLGDRVVLPGNYMIKPAQRAMPLNQMDKAEPTLPDPGIYDSTDIYPSMPCGDAFLQRKHGYTILICNLFPVSYNPKDKIVYYYTSMKVEVEAQDMDAASQLMGVAGAGHEPVLKTDNDRISEVNSLIDNPEVIDTYKRETAYIWAGGKLAGTLDGEESDTYEYVIITTRKLRDASGEYRLQDLTNLKEKRGITTRIATVEDDIYPHYSGLRPDGTEDNPTRIRNFIIDCYNNHDTRYVLLAGDIYAIPSRFCWVETLDEGKWYYDIIMPVDMYYACLDGTFDYDADGIYGVPTDGVDGQDIDLFAEVYIGRAPVATAAEVSNFVKKTIYYSCLAHKAINIPYMVGERLGFGGLGEYAKDSLELIRLGSDLYGHTTTGFENSSYAEFYDTKTLYDKDAVWDKTELINIINSGVHVINHIGHAAPFICMKMYSRDLVSLTNSDYFFVYSQGCSPGAFETENCYAEIITTMEHGAFAAVMNTHYGWGLSNSNDGPSNRYHREFWDALFGEGITNLGRMNQDSKEDLSARINEGDMRWCYYELTLFGDPELSIKTADDIQISISSPSHYSYVRGEVPITGSTWTSQGFDRYDIYYAPINDQNNITYIAHNDIPGPVQDGTLAVWDTAETRPDDSPLAPDGIYKLGLTLYRVDGSAVDWFTFVTVDNYSQEPVFINLSNKAAIIGKTLTLKVEAYDPDDPAYNNWGTLTYSASITGVPGSPSFNAAAKTFSWTPLSTHKGTYKVEFTVRDNEHTISRDILISTLYVQETQITSAAATGNLVIYENNIAWFDYRNGKTDIYLYDLHNQREVRMTDGLAAPGEMDIYENTIVWSDTRNGKSQIYTRTYDPDTGDIGQETRLPLDPGTDFMLPRIYGTKVICCAKGYQYYGFYTILLYDIAAGSISTLIYNDETKSSPDIFGDNLVYVVMSYNPQTHNKDDQVYIYNISSGTTSKITNRPTKRLGSHIWQDRVIYIEDYRDDTVMLYEISNDETRIVSMGDDHQRHCDIQGDKVIWYEERFDTVLKQYFKGQYLYDLANNIELRVIPQAADYNGLYARVYEDKVVWLKRDSVPYKLMLNFLRYAPQIHSISGQTIETGKALTIQGDHFGTIRNDAQVLLGTVSLPIENFSNTEITCRIPRGAQSGLLKVTHPGGASNAISVTVVDSGIDTFVLNTNAENGAIIVEPRKAIYERGDAVTLTAIGHQGSLFTGWSGNISGTENPRTIIMDSNKSITANFSLKTFTLNVATTGAGTVTISPDSTSYAYGETVTLTAIPEAGHALRNWSGDIVSGRRDSLSMIIQKDMSVTANFDIAYSFDVISEHGWIYKTPSYNTYFFGDTVQIRAGPYAGYYFTGWSGSLTSTENPTNVTIDGNKSITANYEQYVYTVTATSTSGGTITPSGQITAGYGDRIVFTITPDLGYHIKDVKFFGSSVGAVGSYTITVYSNSTIHAEFEINSYTLTVTQPQNGSITVSPVETSYTHGETVSLTAIPASGFVFNGWTGNASGTENPITITMDSNKTISANFIEEVIEIYTCDDLNNIRNNLGGRFILMEDLDFAQADPRYTTGLGFEPIGTDTNRFTGIFDGQNYKITGLYINRPNTDYVGLFGSASPTSQIKNITLLDGNITGRNNVGGMAGYNSGTISNCHVKNSSLSNSGTTLYVGGLAGQNGRIGEEMGLVTSCSATGITVYGFNCVGGLIGYNQERTELSFASGEVQGTGYVGGLVGHNPCGSMISDCSAGCNVTGNNKVGGLAGQDTGLVYRSCAFGDVTGVEAVGGLIGQKEEEVCDSYATGNVTGTNMVGGLIGYNWDGGKPIRSYATGNVSGTTNVGGLVGCNMDAASGNKIENCFSTGNVSGQSYVGGIIGSNRGALIIDSYYNHTSGNPAVGSGDGTEEAGCTAIENDEAYFYDTANAPLSNWGYPPWSVINDDRDFPILVWQEGEINIVYGDVDGIPGITAQDALVTLKHAAAIEFLPGDLLEAADVDDTDNSTTSEDITANDALLILMRAAGIPVEFPAEGN